MSASGCSYKRVSRVIFDMDGLLLGTDPNPPLTCPCPRVCSSPGHSRNSFMVPIREEFRRRTPANRVQFLHSLDTKSR